jgi:hypothetical protein
LAFDALLDRTVRGTGPVESRIRQVLAVRALGDFMEAHSRAMDSGEPFPAHPDAAVRTAAGVFRPSAGQFRPTASAVLGSLREGFLAFVAGVASAIVPERRRRHGAFVALLGTGTGDIMRKGSDAAFVEFCRRGPVETLRVPAALVAQSGENGSSAIDSSILYARRPLYRLLRVAPSGTARRLGLVVSMCVSAANAVLRSIIDPRQVLLLRDRLEAPVVRALVSWGSLSEIMFSNSSAKRQPLWARDGTVRTSMIWYSENSKWIWRDGVHDAELPIYRHVVVGTHWVWTDAHAGWLRHVGHMGAIRAVGPILWYLDAGGTAPVPDGVAWVTVFDISPITPRLAATVGLIDNYYSAERCAAFVEGIAKSAEAARSSTGLDIRVRIKPKRVQRHMDPAYADALDRLVASGSLSLMDPAQDLFALARASAISVVQPFSSPAFVARHVGGTACFYDATAVLARPPDLDHRIAFVQGHDALTSLITEAACEWAARFAARLPL